MSVPDEGYSRNVSCTLNLISMFLLEKTFFEITPDRRPTPSDGKCLDGFWPGKLKMTMQTYQAILAVAI